MPTNEEIFKVLRTQGKELSDWLRDNFNPHTAIVITADKVVITQEQYGQPIK